ncbi:MAG: TonB-dependent receptor [Bacteroidota bacterium]
MKGHSTDRRISEKGLVLFLLVVFFFNFHNTLIYSQTSDSLSQQAVVTLPTTVITATRIPTITTAVNRAYEIIHPSEMSAVPPISLEEILRYSSVSGIQSRGVFGVQTDVSIRGSTFSQNLILIDGQRLNDPQTGHHTFDVPVGIDEIERVEIVKGHASAQYGADAYAGVINIITKRPTDESLTLRLGGGEYGLLTGSASFTTNNTIVKTRNTFEIRKSDGFRDDTEFTIWNMTTNNELNFPIGNYTLLGGYTKKKFGAFDFYSPGRNAASKEKTAVGWITLGTEITAGSLLLQPKVRYRRHDDEFIYMPGSTPNTHTTHVAGGEIVGTMTFSKSTSLLLGVEGNWDRITSTSLGNHHRSTQAIFSTFQTLIDSIFSFDIGTRQDWHSDYGRQFSPGIGIGYIFMGTTKIFASAGRSFRAPSYTDLYYNDPANVGNPNLSPEIGWSYELGIRNSSIQNFMISSAIFLRDQRDLIDYVQFFDGDQYHAVNFTGAETRGGELGIEWLTGNQSSHDEFPLSIRNVNVNYLFLSSRIDRGSSYRTKYSLNHPRHTLSGLIVMDLPIKIKALISGTWKERTSGESYTLIDISARKEINPVWVYITAQNVFDAAYEEIPGVPQPGRWIRGGIELRLK